MYSKAKVVMAQQKQPTEIDQLVIGFMQEVIRTNDAGNQEDCTTEGVEQDSGQNENNGQSNSDASSLCDTMDYQLISLQDIKVSIIKIRIKYVENHIFFYRPKKMKILLNRIRMNRHT